VSPDTDKLFLATSLVDSTVDLDGPGRVLESFLAASPIDSVVNLDGPKKTPGSSGGGEAEGVEDTGRTMEAVGPLATAVRRRASPVEVETRRRPATSTISLCACRKSIPRMGNCTAARRNRQSNRRPEKLSWSKMSPQQGMVAPAGPVRRGPDGGELER